jgi:Asp-tRNA(Asn)/Glu-tRNA(Gln) amidotransferase A subunit family amidase
MSLLCSSSKKEPLARQFVATNPSHSAGASTGGLGAAFLVFGGRKIEIKSDVGGSERMSVHFCGIYGLKASSGGFASAGNATCWLGIVVQTVISPMATVWTIWKSIYRFEAMET